MTRAIRSVVPSDASSVQAIYAPFVADGATSFEIGVPETSEIEQRIRAQSDRYPWLVFEGDQAILGYAYASSHRARLAYQWCVEVSVYVRPEWHRQGIGRALYTALFDILRRQGYVNAYAGITLPNPSSEALHESLGFVPVGVYRQVGFKFGRWHDVAWLHLRLQDARAPEHDPLTIHAMWKDPAISAMLNACAERTVITER